MKNKFLPLVMLLIGSCIVSCNDNDDTSVIAQSSTITFENKIVPKDFVQSGTFKGIGDDVIMAPVVLPGQSINFKFNAGKTQSLMFATMYGASKDWFFAPEHPGLKLYDTDGNAITGDVSAQIKLWDNGTKDDVTGDIEDKDIAMVPNVDASQLMKLELEYNASTSEFTLIMTNTSGGTMNETPFSPGVWAVSNFLGGNLLNNMPFFKPGQRSNIEITAIAEMGNNELLAVKTKEKTGIITGLSPVLVVVYSGDINPIYELGKKDEGKGLKFIAQMGNVSTLKENLINVAGVKGVYVAGNAPIGPGQKESVQFESTTGDKIAYVTMFGYSNDWFYANEPIIFANEKGDITNKTSLFDDGTGVDQYPGAGNNQALFGGTPALEDVVISKVGDDFPVPELTEVIKVTIE
ncbi:spondin domain-containing protein [Flavobacterium sp. '19STA2R22 D10 B1']|uniref:spondin domain-containing protein n=1 Tax=Flavobacterium aerium TaxID=3037261 RepID=UPI00278C00F2|nr:spondin domain-containing protein [Flavobacterium sp. '19STA2R22 D10 B1']